jgi:hypothetical protein
MAISPPSRKCEILDVSHSYGPPRPVTGTVLCFYFTFYRVHTSFMYKQDIHKRMVQFPKLITNVFLTLHGHNVHCQQRGLSTFFVRYQQFASHAYCRAAGPAPKVASQQEKASCVLRYEVFRFVIIVQSEFRSRFKKTHHKRKMSFLNRARNSRCTVITDLDTSKRSKRKAFSCCYAI